jgi:hypothetical protein
MLLVAGLSPRGRIQSQAIPYGMFSEQSGTGTGFFLSTSLFLCQYQSTGDPCSFIHLTSTLYKLTVDIKFNGKSLDKDHAWHVRAYRNSRTVGVFYSAMKLA